MSKNSITCTQSSRGQFTEGKSYKIDTRYDAWLVVNDDSGSFHHLNTNGEFFKEHFE